MSETDLYIERLLVAEPLRQPVLRAAVQALNLPLGSHGLDAGCGIGLQMRLLADAVGLDGQAAGLDLDPEMLVYGEALAREQGLANRLTFHQGDVNRLPFSDRAFDWAWSADCIGYPGGDLAPALRELMRVVKPGGSIALLGWSSQQVLPGYPLLEARLNATNSAYSPFLTGKPAEQHFLCARRAFREVGLEQVKAQTFVRDVVSPFGTGERAGLISLFDMLWGQRQPETAMADWEAYQRLCRPESPTFILDQPDYYGFFTYTLFSGIVP